MCHRFDKLLLDEMRLVVCSPDKTSENTHSDIPDLHSESQGNSSGIDPNNISRDKSPDRFLRAMTVNENLKAFGFTLTPDGISLLATCATGEQARFLKTVESCVDTVDAEPMFPDFPKQVMSMSEAEYRLVQMIHYFSTYDIEEISGLEVRRGWLPDVASTPKTCEDAQLLDLKVLHVIEDAERYSVPFKRVVGKRERLSGPESDILTYICSECDSNDVLEWLRLTPVPFKENLMPITFAMSVSMTPDAARHAIVSACQHTGDVLKCARYALAKSNYHFNKPMKRLWIACLEAYPIGDFRENIALSRKKAQGVLLVARFLDYNRMSRSEAHKQALRDLKSGKLTSWESQMKRALEESPSRALKEISKRPGMLLRWYNWLARRGLSPRRMSRLLKKNAETLSVRSLIAAIQAVRRNRNGLDKPLIAVLKKRMRLMDTPVKGKKVFVDPQQYVLNESAISKSEEGGYVRPGLTIRIPNSAKRIRFFVYWNDPNRVDVDLHSYGMTLQRDFVHIGWNASYNIDGIVTSGDITHSDAAEYIDIDLSATNCSRVANALNLFCGKPCFGDIETCLVGLMAVRNIGEDCELYDPKNCFFSHNLRSQARYMAYCLVNVSERTVTLCLKNLRKVMSNKDLLDRAEHDAALSIAEYLSMLLRAQGAVLVDDPRKADVTLTMEHADEGISLLDEDFFMDA